MSLKSTRSGYGGVAQALHWISVLAILPMGPLGLAMVGMEPGATQTLLYQTHIVLGWAVLALTAGRVIWRFFDPTPDAPAGVTGWNLWAYRGVHVLLYLVLLALAFSGTGMLALSGLSLGNLDPAAIANDLPPAAGHVVFSRLYMGLLAAHLAGVFIHQFTKGDVLGRMGVPWFKPR